MSIRTLINKLTAPTPTELTNLFNPLTVRYDKFLSTTTFAIGNLTGFAISDYIPVTPGQTLIISGLPSYDSQKCIQYANAAKVLISGALVNSNNLRVTTPPLCAYIIITVKTTTDLTVNLNNICVSQVPAVAPAISTPLASSNLFNPLTPNWDHNIDTNTFGIGGQTGWAVSDFIAVVPGQLIAIKGLQSFGSKAIQYLNSSKVLISGAVINADNQQFTTPALCFFIRFSIKEGVNGNPDPITDFSGIYCYDVNNARMAITDFGGQKIKATELAISKTYVKALFPPKIYCVYNDIKAFVSSTYNRMHSTAIYLDHTIILSASNTLRAKFRESGVDKVMFYSQKAEDGSTFNNGSNVDKQNIPLTITGDFYDVRVTVSQVSTKATQFAASFPKVLIISDSNADGVDSAKIDTPANAPSRFHDFTRTFFEMDRIDAGNPGGSYNFLSLGDNNVRTWNFTYGGTNLNGILGCASGIGGWSAMDYLFYTDRRNASQGVWDLLGLGNGTGTDYTGSAAQLATLYSTPEGKFAPVNTAAFIAYMQTTYPGQGITNYTNAAAYCTTLLSNPINPYFNKDKAGANRFDLALYLSRYKTLADDGTTRLTVGTTAGTKVVTNTAWNLCTPTHIVFMLGTNDCTKVSAAVYLTNMTTLVAEVKAFSAAIIVGVAMPDSTGTYFPELYPEFNSLSFPDTSLHPNAWVFNQQLMTLDNEANKIFYLPFFFVAPTAYGTPYREVNQAQFQNSGLQQHKFFVRDSAFPAQHLNGNAHAALGYQLYAWIKYSLTL